MAFSDIGQSGKFVWIQINAHCELLEGLYDGYDPSLAPGEDFFNDCVLVAMRQIRRPRLVLVAPPATSSQQ